MSSRDAIEAQIIALEQEVLSLENFSHNFFARADKGVLLAKIATLKQHPVFWPEICHQLRSWRGERGIREVMPILQNAGIEISINEFARIEGGRIEGIAPELLQQLEQYIKNG